MVESKEQAAAQEQKAQGGARYEHLRAMEKVQARAAYDNNSNVTNATVGYENQTFEEKNASKYFCTFPFPYMNGYMHLGHAFSITKCEYQVRYQRQQGKNALFPFSFHCTGMPIQASSVRLTREIESGKIKSASKEEGLTQYEILLQLGIDEAEIPKFKDPLHWLGYFPPKGQQDLIDFGLATDWRRSFITTSENPFYDSFIRWQFYHLKQNNKVKFGKRYTVYSALDGQACSDHDRAKGEGVAPQEYTGIKIQLLEMPECLAAWEGKPVFLIAATLRPETMYGQTNCFILPTGEYGLFEMKNGDFFVMSERAAKNFSYQEMTKEERQFPCLAKVMGSDIVGKKLKAPLTKYEFVYALPMTTISMVKGTGIVTSVPSDSPADFVMLRDLKKKPDYYKIQPEWVESFEPVPIIEIPGMGNMCAQQAVESRKIGGPKDKDKLEEAKDECYQKAFNDGVMTIEGECNGKKVEDAKLIIKKQMIAEGQAVPYYEPESEVVSRTGDSCVCALCDQWMMNYGEENWKNQVMDHVKSDSFECYSDKTQKEFEHILNWLKEWGCSRTVGLGTKLPWDEQFVVESLSDSTIYMAYYTVSHLLQGSENMDGKKAGPLGIKAEAMTQAAWDYVFLGKDYDAAACPDITEELLGKMRHEFEFWYPMDMRTSGKDLIRNHLTMSLYNHTAIWEDKKKWTRSYFCNGWLLLNGEKMSKSTGNFKTLREVMDTYGVNAMRIALADAGDGLDDANFETETANQAILKLCVLERWMKTNVDKIFEVAGEQQLDFNNHNTDNYDTWDKLFINKMNEYIELCDKGYSGLHYRDVVKYGFYEMMSLKESYMIGKDQKPNAFVLLMYMQNVLIVLNPICPHFCQNTWQEIVRPAMQKCANLPAEPKEQLQEMGWPKGDVEKLYISMFAYLTNVKSEIRQAHIKASAGDKKKGKKGKAPAETEPAPVLENCHMFVGLEFPQYKKQVLEVLQTLEFEFETEGKNAGKPTAALKKQLAPAVGAVIKDKKQAGLAMSFANFVLEDAFKVGKEQALQISLPFDEQKIIQENITFLFENMFTIKSQVVLMNTDEACGANKAFAEGAVPGKPSILFN